MIKFIAMKAGKLLASYSFIFVFILSFPFAVYAHGVPQTLEQKAGDYTAVLGYDPLDISLGSASPLTFTLKEEKSGQEVVFDDVWVSIKKEESFLFAGGIKYAKFGVTSLTYTFGQSGNYEISARYEKADKTLAEATFPLTVTLEETNKGQDNPLSNIDPLVYAAGGLVFGLVGGLFLGRKIKEKK